MATIFPSYVPIVLLVVFLVLAIYTSTYSNSPYCWIVFAQEKTGKRYALNVGRN
jgi:hypothetical protein